MFNRRLSYVLLYFTSFSCLAQSFFGSSPQSAPSQPNQYQSSSSTGSNRVMSPSEYGNMVNSLSQQNQADLTQAAKTDLNKQSNTPAAPSQTTTTTSTSVSTSSPTPDNSSTPSPAAPINLPPPTATLPPPSLQQQPPVTASAPLPAPRPSAPVITPQPAAPVNAPSSQPYTGFGNFGNTNSSPTTSPNSSTGNSGGWDIKY